MSDSTDEGRGVIAERLDRLFAEVHPLGRPYTLKEAVAGINDKAGEPLVSVQYLSQLRKGDRRRPSLEVLQAIAAWFGVRVTYFTDDDVARRTDEELRTLALMRDTGVRSVAFRAAGISQQSLDMVRTLLEKIRAAEGLPPTSGDDEPGERPDISWPSPGSADR